jgi:hypothetical protein
MADSELTDSPFETLIKERASQGWNYIGIEPLTRTKFSHEARFEDVPFQTKEDIKTRYSGGGVQDVDLVLRLSPKIEELRRLVTPEEFAKLEIGPQDKSYLVFVRNKQSK